MFRRVVLILFILFFANSVFAIDRKELNPEFFSKFNDVYLYNYINEAILNNHSAKQASARVEQYRQQVKSNFGKELPTLSIGANYLGVKIPTLDDFRLKKSAFVLPFIANYEADFLLKNHDKTKSAKKLYEIAEQNEKIAYLSLLSDVATAYLNVLQYDELIKIQEELIINANNILENDKRKFGRGVINSTTLNNSQKDFEIAKNNLEELIKNREISLMQLAILIGISSECTENIQRGSFEDFEYKFKIPDEIKSDVIFSRPDVIMAEKQLEKAKIDVRVARKEFLPTFNITGIWIFNTLADGKFFSWNSSLASLMAGAMQDIFAGGKKMANFKFQKAKYEELFENYRQTDLEAVKEVNTSLCIIKHDTNIDNNTQNQLVFETQNYQNAQKMLNQGVISNNDFYNLKRKYLVEKFEKTQTKTQRLIDYFTLYKAVGGKL